MACLSRALWLRTRLCSHNVAWKRSFTSGYLLCQDETNTDTTPPPPPPPEVEEAPIPEEEEEVPKETIGFIGLGNMGAHMAVNLMKAGYNLIVNDVYPEAMSPLKAMGAVSVTTPVQVAERTNKIITMLPSSPEVKEVYSGDLGIFRAMQEGTLLLDSSTIDPSMSKEISARAAEHGGSYMDAPVSGGVIAARDGILTFMVGGKADDYAIAKEILEPMAKTVIHCGGVGTGQAAKICNNMLLAVSMIGTAEAMNLGTRLGLDKKMLAHILNISTGRCWSSELYNPCPGVVDGVPSSNNYQGGFGTRLMAKDLGLAQNAATSTKSATPMGSLAHQTYRIMCNRGYGKLDFSSVFKYLREEEG